MKIPRDLSGQKTVKNFVKNFGWTIHRREGSHVTLKKEGVYEILTIPMHNKLDVGTLLAILRKAGIDKEEFLKKL